VKVRLVLQAAWQQHASSSALHVEFELEGAAFQGPQQQRQQLEFHVTTTCWDPAGGGERNALQQQHAFTVQPECPEVSCSFLTPSPFLVALACPGRPCRLPWD
jgi:hypothetical protein